MTSLESSSPARNPWSVRLLELATLMLLVNLLAPACVCDEPGGTPAQPCVGAGCSCNTDDDCAGETVCRFGTCVGTSTNNGSTNNGVDDAGDAEPDIDVIDEGANNGTDDPDADDTDVEMDVEVVEDADVADEPDAPPMCEDDEFEENDTNGAARTLAAGADHDLVACPGDNDWFSVAADVGEEIVVDVTTTATLGVSIRQPFAANLVAAAAVRTDDGYHVRFTPSQQGQFPLLIQPLDRTGMDYHLHVTVQPATCVPDDFEPNDEQAQALQLFPSPSPNPLTMCGDEDWFFVEVAAGNDLLVTTQQDPDELGGTVLIELRDSNGQVVAATDASSTALRHSVVEGRQGRYDIRLYSTDANGPYGLIVETPPTDTCTNDTFEPNNGSAEALPIPLDQTHDLVLCTEDSDWFSFEASAGVVAEALVDAPDISVRADIVDLDGRTIISLQRPAPDGTLARAFLPDAGTYFVRVVSPGAEIGPYTLHLSLNPCLPDALEPNDTSDAASIPVVDRDYDDLRICEGDVDWFRFPDLLPGQEVFIDAGVREGTGTLRARLFRAVNLNTPIGTYTISGPTVSFSADAPTGGDLYLAIDGTTAFRQYTLRATLSEVCLPDAQESNDNITGAAQNLSALGLYTDLTICSDDFDYFCYLVPDDTQIVATAFFEHDDGDLEIQLVTPTGQPLGASATSSDIERVQYYNFISGQDEIVCVWVLATGFDPTVENDYTLEVSFGGEANCVDDTWEDNDGPQNATLLRDRRASLLNPIPLGLIFSNPQDLPAIEPLRGVKVCAADPDAYRFFGLDGDTLNVQLDFDTARGDLALDIYRLTGLELVASVDTATDNESLSVTLPANDEYVIWVTGPTTDNQTYSLNVDLVGACIDDADEPNDQRTAATPLPTGLFENIGLCAGDVDWYAIPLEAGQTLHATAWYLAYRVDVDIELYNSNETLIARSNSIEDLDNIVYTPTVAGTYYLKVLPFDPNASTSYDLTIDIEPAAPSCPLDGAEPNDQEGEEAGIAYDGSDAERGGLTLCRNDVDRFIFTLFERQSVEVTTTVPSSTASSLFTVTGPDDTAHLGLSIPGGQAVTLDDAPPGEYVIELARAGNGPVRLDYAIGVHRLPSRCIDDAYEPNDDPDVARRVSPGVLDGMTLCGATRDCFAVDVSSGELHAQLIYDHHQADVQLRVYDPTFEPIATSNNVNDAETIDLQNLAAARYVVCATALRAFADTVDYDLSIDTGSGCPPRFNNVTRDAARELPLLTPLPVKLCGGERWYAILTVPGEGFEVEMTYDPAQGTPRLDLHNPDATLIDVSNGGTGSDLVGEPNPTGHVYWVKLSGPAMNVTLEAIPEAPSGRCVEDPSDTDTVADARRLTLNVPIGGHLCDAVDTYKTSVVAGDELFIELNNVTGDGDIGLDILDATGSTVLVRGRALRQSVRARYVTPIAQDLIIRVRPDQRYLGPYSIAAWARRARLLCAHDVDEPNGDLATSIALLSGRGARLGSICGSETDAFTITLGAGESIEASVVATSGLSPAFTLRDPSNAVLATGAALDATKKHLVYGPAAGTWLLHLQNPASTSYRLAWTRLVPTPCTDDAMEPNNSVANARTIPLGTHLNLIACSADDDYYRIRLNPGETLAVSVASDISQGDVELEILDQNGQVVARSARADQGYEYATFKSTLTGNATIRVFRPGASSQRYTLGVDLIVR